MNKLFLSVIAAFIKDYQAEAFAISNIIKQAKRDIKNQLDEQAKKRLEPLIEELFSNGIKASNTIVKKEVALLADLVGQPFKYNKDLLLTLNDKSVFAGFYDKNYKGLYTKKEIDKLKRVILTGKYGQWKDRELSAEIRKTINLTKNQSLILARAETQRLDGAAKQIFFEQPKVKKEYVKVYHALDGPEHRHQWMDGQIADDDGYFTSKQGTKFLFPPNPDSPWNCMCWTSLEKRA